MYDRCLLDLAGVVVKQGRWAVDDCYWDLRKSTSQPPRYALANNLWVGPIPWELQCLMFLEQLLISWVFPRVFIFKLFPKAVGQYPADQLQRGMRGNVVSYEQDMEGIAAMIEGRLMPWSLRILASVLSITFIGVGRLPQNWLHSTFHVRREVVRAALKWLQTNNPKYYGDIVLDESRLNALLDDGVLQEVMGIIWQSTETLVVDEEQAGFIVGEDDECHDAGLFFFGGYWIMDSHFVERFTESAGDANSGCLGPDVIPLQILGGCDNHSASLSANDIMKWGLANLWKEGREGGYAVRHSQNAVRDFAPQAGEPNYFERAFPILVPYGIGGIEADRPVHLDYRNHIKWALQFHDQRFRQHESFAFIAFAILQHRQALNSARLQMQRHSFDQVAHIISTIRPEDLRKAEQEEIHGRPISNGAVKVLFSQIRATAARVLGSDATRYRN